MWFIHPFKLPLSLTPLSSSIKVHWDGLVMFQQDFSWQWSWGLKLQSEVPLSIKVQTALKIKVTSKP